MMEKKKVIITLCKVFPVTHTNKGVQTGFEDKLKSGEKIHTIRFNGNDVWEKRYQDISSGSKYLSVREWIGRPYNSEQREFARYDKIGLQHIKMSYETNEPVPVCWVDGKKIPIEDIAAHDGLSLDDFIEWFFNKNITFEGVIIHFTDFRY